MSLEILTLSKSIIIALYWSGKNLLTRFGNWYQSHIWARAHSSSSLAKDRETSPMWAWFQRQRLRTWRGGGGDYEAARTHTHTHTHKTGRSTSVNVTP